VEQLSLARLVKRGGCARRKKPMKARRLRTPVAVLLLAVQTAGLAHLVLARHETCAEQGAIVEAPGTAEAQGPAENGTRSAGAATATIENADDHCAFFATERRTLTVAFVAAALPDLATPSPVARPTSLRSSGIR
jgi:hypothetical protein